MSDLTLQTPVPETPANTSAARVPSDSLPGLKGMWVAVCLEYLEFTMFFSVYFVARWFHPQAFQEGAARLWTWGGVAVTLVMLTSGYALTQAIVALASEYGRYGYRRITPKLRDEGWNVRE